MFVWNIFYDQFVNHVQVEHHNDFKGTGLDPAHWFSNYIFFLHVSIEHVHTNITYKSFLLNLWNTAKNAIFSPTVGCWHRCQKLVWKVFLVSNIRNIFFHNCDIQTNYFWLNCFSLNLNLIVLSRFHWSSTGKSILI